MKESYLIQRAKINRFVTSPNVTGIDSVLNYDYMGSAEFEFGALGYSAREICQNLSSYKIVKSGLKQINKDLSNDREFAASLFLICKEGDAEGIEKNINLIMDKKMHLKESSYFRESLLPAEFIPVKKKGSRKKGRKATIEKHFQNENYFQRNVWWDIGNHWFAVLGKENVELVMLGLMKLRGKWLASGKIKE